MGTGKTEVGRELSRLLAMRLIDVDEEIVRTQRMSINEIFARFGEERFRDLETEMIEHVCRETNVIIATGGGAVLRQRNIDALKRHGIIVCLTATPETILERTIHSSERPLLRNGNAFDKITQLLRIRQPFYENADIMVSTDDKTPLQVAEEIIEKVRSVRRSE